MIYLLKTNYLRSLIPTIIRIIQWRRFLLANRLGILWGTGALNGALNLAASGLFCPKHYSMDSIPWKFWTFAFTPIKQLFAFSILRQTLPSFTLSFRLCRYFLRGLLKPKSKDGGFINLICCNVICGKFRMPIGGKKTPQMHTTGSRLSSLAGYVCRVLSYP